MAKLSIAMIQHGPKSFYKNKSFHMLMSSLPGRLNEIELLMKKAETVIGGDRDVKIAICPEHYLSKKHGSETQTALYHEIGGIIPILKSLKSLSDRYNDWLIIPGTITVMGLDETKGKDLTQRHLSSVSIPETFSTIHARSQYEELEKYKRERLEFLNTEKSEENFRPFYNLSPIYYNGKIVKIRRKKLEAVAEGTSLDRVGDDSEKLYFPLIENSSVLVHKGLRIGVEICSEHEYGSLLAEVKENLLDIHIVISNEVYPFVEHSAIKPGGIFVHSGTETCGIYRQTQLPISTNDAFTYQHEKTPGIYIENIEI